MYKKSTKRIRAFKLKCLGVKLPLSPVFTWLKASIYHANYFEDIKSAISELDSKDSVAISTAKAFIESAWIVTNLVYISALYSSIPNNIKALDTKGLPLVESLALAKKSSG